MSNLKLVMCLFATTLWLESATAGPAKSEASCATTRNGVCIEKNDTRKPSSVRNEPDPKKCKVAKHIIVNDVFIEAIENNNLNCVAYFSVKEEININMTGSLRSGFYGKTPLMVASQLGKLDAIELITTREDLDFNKQDREGKTAFFIAVHKDQFEVIKQLLTFESVDINKEDNNQNTPLMVASINGQYEIVRTLLEQNRIDIDKKNSQGLTAYDLSKENKHKGITQLFLAHVREHENELDTERCFFAAKTGNLTALKVCLAKDVDINARQRDGSTFLMSSVTYEQPKVLDFLLENPNTNVNAQDSRGSTALILAARVGTLEDVKGLLSREDINIYLTDRQGLTALDYAKKRTRFLPHKKELTYAIDAISDLEKQHKEDLFKATRRGNMVLLKSTLETGIDVNARLSHNIQSTPLISASQMVQEEVAEHLLTLPNVDVNLQTSNGYTALMMASISSSAKIIKLLVKGESDNLALTQSQRANIAMNTQNIDLMLKNVKGETAFDIAKNRGHEEIIKLLADAGGREEGARAFFRSLFRR